MAKSEPQEDFDWDGVITQIYETIGTPVALFDKYGLILASNIEHFAKNFLISPTILDFIERKNSLTKDLKVKKLNCLVLEGDKENIVFAFGPNFNLMSNVPQNVDLAKFMPSITNFLATLHRTYESKQVEEKPIEVLSLDSEFEEIISGTQREVGHERFPIFKHLIKYLAKK